MTSKTTWEGSGMQVVLSAVRLNGWKMNFFFRNLGSLNWKSASVGRWLSCCCKLQSSTAGPEAPDTADPLRGSCNFRTAFLGDLAGDRQMLSSSLKSSVRLLSRLSSVRLLSLLLVRGSQVSKLTRSCVSVPEDASLSIDIRMRLLWHYLLS